MATRKVDEAMIAALKNYPDSAEMFKLVERLRTQVEFWDQLRNQGVTTPEAKVVENASKTSVEEEVSPDTPLESMAQQTTPIEKYPGEEGKDDASVSGTPV